MPRIPVRTTPYHTLPRCTRHYKSKRDLALRSLGKASFINGSQFVIAWISPKGEVDIYASELLQSALGNKEGGVVNRKELDREAARIKGEMARRWEEIRRLEENGEAPVMEDEDNVEQVEVEAEEDEDINDDIDPDRTLVEDGSSDSARNSDFGIMSLKKSLPSANTMMSSFPAATRSSTPAPPMHTLTLAPDAIENYYSSRFAALQQATCKLVVKAWIKVIEPKKQMKYPYNKGEDLKPAWWPEGVRHREPDHLSKIERLTLLTSIVRSPLVTVSRLELSTAEAGAFITRPRQAILREVYLVAKEEEKRQASGESSSELIVHLPNVPVSPSAVSPESTSGKRSHVQYDTSAGSTDKENLFTNSSVYSAHQQKRVKHVHPHAARLAPLTATHPANYYDHQQQPNFTYTQAPQWREVSTAHLSPYPSELGYSGSEYGRSPNPEQQQQADGRFAPHPTHLAPLLNHHATHSPVDSPAFPQTATLAPPTVTTPNSAYYPRGGAGQSYMQQQQIEYLQAHGHAAYDYGSPYLADGTWEGQFAQPAA